MLKQPFDPSTLPRMPWASPASNPYSGPFDAALLNYRAEIPLDPLNDLRTQVQAPATFGRYVVINKDGIYTEDGKRAYKDLRMMHFGDGRLLRAVIDTSKWPPGQETGALVFQSAQYCVCIPTVCRNVSLVTPLKPIVDTFAAVPVKKVHEPGSLALVAAAGAVAWVVRRRAKLHG